MQCLCAYLGLKGGERNSSNTCGQRNNSVFPKRPGEHVLSTIPFFVVVVILVSYLKTAAPAFAESQDQHLLLDMRTLSVYLKLSWMVF